MPELKEIKLTQFTKGGGCGCKIAPKVLEEILKNNPTSLTDKNILVGNESKDDAAVYDLGNGTAIISTTDFFTPIVDDAFDFGKIASANSISDVYAMGGKPLMAIGILGWPVDKLPPEMAATVLEGAKQVCNEAGISLAGGHSIDSPEPFFGLAVTGIIDIKKLKKNNTAKEGDLIYLTKKIGIGILTSAEKRGIIKEEHKGVASKQMMALNNIGEEFGKMVYVSAMTDVTGFGLLGHLLEMAEGSGLSAEIDYSKIKMLDGVDDYLKENCYPDNTFRNWTAYASKVTGMPGNSLMTLCDPQTNGGLLVAVNKAYKEEFEKFLKQNGYEDFSESIGYFRKTSIDQKIINVI